MLKREEQALERVRQCLDAGRVREAFVLLKDLREHASEELRERDMWRVHELFGACFHDLGDPEGAAQAYLEAARCDRFLRSQRQHFSGYLFSLHYLPGISPEEMARQNLAYGSLYRDTEPLPKREPTSSGKLRLGYLAPSFSEQAAARFYETMLTKYDRERFEVFCYSMEQGEDEFAGAMREQTDGWRVLSDADFEGAASVIRRDGVDILFDLGGHSEGGVTLMVMAYRPGRVQVSGIGWMDTTGLPAMDFLLADDVLAPKSCGEGLYSERLLRLPHAVCWKPTKAMESLEREPRKKGSPIRLGCFNNFMKITEDMLRIWGKILRELPGATLLLQDVSAHPARQEEMRRRIGEAGLSGRAEVRPASPDYLRQLREIDVALDTHPYTGGGMTAAALYMGTPVVTMEGDRYGSRFGACILQGAGFPQFIARSPEEYVAKAVELAGDESRLEFLQGHLRQRMEESPLMDGEGYMRSLEEAWRILGGAGQNQA